jgi:branched-chain amino acid transport system substrate-binding protein
MLLARAMEMAGSTEPGRYVAELRRIRYDGVTAAIEFDARGDLKASQLSVFRVQNGRWALQ